MHSYRQVRRQLCTLVQAGKQAAMHSYGGSFAILQAGMEAAMHSYGGSFALLQAGMDLQRVCVKIPLNDHVQIPLCAALSSDCTHLYTGIFS